MASIACALRWKSYVTTTKEETKRQAVTELSFDRNGVQSEHDAIHYLAELETSSFL